ncbi:hypothetical protein D9M71_17190 [compost metagenome]
MTTQNTGFKAFSTKVNSTAIHTIQAANEPTETQPKPSSEPDKTVEPSKDVPQTK